MGLRRTVAPVDYPVTLAEAKHQIAELGTEHDEYITRLIEAATDAVERETARALITQTWELTLDEFDSPIKLPKPPYQSVTHIKYIDEDGTLQTLSASVYQLSRASQPATIELAYDQSWPSTRCEPDAVRVTYVAGYGAAADVPQALRHAILLLVSQWFGYRESVISGTIIQDVSMSAKWLMAPFDMTEYA